MNDKYKQIVNLYIRAKDRHHPHLMRLAFAEDAILKMEVNTDTITFPTESIGLQNITATLVREFHQRFENIYTFCINDSAEELEDEFRCRWLVGMTGIDSGCLRVGYGNYHWKFDKNNNGDLRAQQLNIFIHNMTVLPVSSAAFVMPWFDILPHPWLSYEELSSSAPDLSVIEEFLKPRGRVS